MYITVHSLNNTMFSIHRNELAKSELCLIKGQFYKGIIRNLSVISHINCSVALFLT